MIWVWVGYSSTRPPTPLLVAQIEFSKQFKEFMRLGFSASNGQGSSIHIVDRWRFKTFGSLPPGIPMDAVEEGDCFMCSLPEDSSGNSSPVDHSHERKTKMVEMALGLVVLGVATGRKPVVDDGTVVVDWVWGMWENGKLIEAADRRLMGRYSRVGKNVDDWTCLCAPKPCEEANNEGSSEDS